ncbi:CBS domain-containing protein [Halalkalibacter lacteus]|uniref:CBS domain-containing protein n=1 Tax=Halalkalibacter lacteus TaxID=3090663 RepID=UPI002FCA74CF
MDVIVSHVNLDFDGLASLLAAKKLYPSAKVALSAKQHPTVKSYLAIYRDQLAFTSYEGINWGHVTTLILVDVASLKRTGIPTNDLSTGLKTIIYDHHTPKENDVRDGERYVEQVGATITLLMERLVKEKVAITPFEATLFGLGLYTDTGNFTYKQTTSRDLFIASILKEREMDVTLINRFSEQALTTEERKLFQTLLTNSEEIVDSGITLLITTHEQPTYQNGLATLTRRLMESTDSDAALSIVKMKDRVYVVARSSSNRIDFRPLMNELGGGGHAQAASATMKKQELANVLNKVKHVLKQIIKPAVTASEMMAKPVKSVSPYDSINNVLEQMYQYGHTGFPVLDEDGLLVGVISRRDVDKATHHGLGHAPVKAYMSTQIVTLEPSSSLEEIQTTMMKHNIGRIPIVSKQNMLGIVSRTDVIEQLHRESGPVTDLSVVSKMQAQLPPAIYNLLHEIGEIADTHGINVYLIGGIVRDFLLNRPNEDIDLVVEGDGITFSNAIAEQLGGQVKTHEQFGTATWTTPANIKLDIVTCRTEYYDAPAALPTVRPSNIREDLRRRDFTINALALQINKSEFGTLLDFFQGQEDMNKKKIRILHTLSFIEDPTRIVRAVRFALRFDYELADQTQELALNASFLLNQVSATRFLREIQLLIKEKTILRGVKLLDSLNVWHSLFKTKPTFESLMKLEQVLAHNFNDAFIVILTLNFEQSSWKKKVKRYSLTTKQNQIIQQIEAMETVPISRNDPMSSIHNCFHLFREESILLYALLTQNGLLLSYVKKREQLKPLLTGQDLLDQGIKPGPIFSDLLHQLTSLQLDNEIVNRKEALTWLQAIKKE